MASCSCPSCPRLPLLLLALSFMISSTLSHTVYLHIGPHKTATTSFQHTIVSNTANFASLNIKTIPQRDPKDGAIIFARPLFFSDMFNTSENEQKQSRDLVAQLQSRTSSWLISSLLFYFYSTHLQLTILFSIR